MGVARSAVSLVFAHVVPLVSTHAFATIDLCVSDTPEAAPEGGAASVVLMMRSCSVVVAVVVVAVVIAAVAVWADTTRDLPPIFFF